MQRYAGARFAKKEVLRNDRISRRGWRAISASLSQPSASEAVSLPRGSITLAAVFGCSLALSYCSACRSSTSVALIPMSKEMHWNPDLVGHVQGAFLLGYAATQALGGAAADRHGGKSVLAWGLAINALATLLVTLILGKGSASLAFSTAWVLRWAAGAGQGVAMPSMNQIVATRVPKEGRSSALGIVFAGFHAGNVLGLVVSPSLVAAWGWKGLFVFYGVLGLPILMAWNLLVQNTAHEKEAKMTVLGSDQNPTNEEPAMDIQSQPHTTDGHFTADESDGQGQKELQTTQGKPLREGQHSPEKNRLKVLSDAFLPLLRPRACLGAMLAHAANHAAFFVVLSWTPTFFATAKGLSLQDAAWMATIPWIVIAIWSPMFGKLADAAISRGLPRLYARRGAQIIGSFCSAISFILFALSADIATPVVSCVLLCTAMGCLAAGQAGFASSEIEIVAPRRVGAMVGACNTIASLAGMASTTLAGLCLARWPGNWTLVYLAVATVLILGGSAFTMWIEDRVVVQ